MDNLRCGVEPVKTLSRAITGPGMMGRVKDLVAQAHTNPPGVRKNVRRKVKRRMHRAAWRVTIGGWMSSGKNKSVKSGDIFGFVLVFL